jgi:dihydroflavonol-4-reductase
MILVTGANGLVGSYLCRYLIMQGTPIRALKRPDSNLRLVSDIAHKIEWVDGDVNDVMSLEAAMQGIEKVYHCAAIISYSKKNADKLMLVNVEGTANVVNIALEFGVKKLVHLSSIAAVGKTGRDGETVVEDTPWERKNFTSNYAISKFLAEREVWRAIAEGLNAVIINPSIIVGAGNWDSGSCKLFTTVYNGFKYYTEGVTGYVDVRDVVKIATQLMESDITEQRFIVNAENVMYRDFLQTIGAGLNVQGPTVKAGKNLSALAWRVEWVKSLFNGKEPSVTKQTAAIANKKVFYNNEKIKQTLGYQFIPIRESITDAAKCFLEEKKDNQFHPLTFK